MQCQQSSILSGHINELFKLCLQLEFKFTHLKPGYVRRIKLLKLEIRALHLVFLMKATNKSALNSTEIFLKELELLQQNGDQVQDSPFLKDLIQSLAEDQSQRKAGNLVKILQPLLSKHPIKSLPFDESIRMSHATIYEPKESVDVNTARKRPEIKQSYFIGGGIDDQDLRSQLQQI